MRLIGAWQSFPRWIVLGVLTLSLVTMMPAATRAQAGLGLTTPYTSIVVQPGSAASFELALRAETATQVQLTVEGAPDGWTTALRGGGNEVRGAYVDPATPLELVLDVRVPAEAGEGAQPISVVASGGGETVRLGIEVVVAAGAGGSVALNADFPSVRGPSDATFQFSLQLVNDTPQQLTFSLQAQGPRGWDLSVQPAGQERAASVTIDAGATQQLSVDAVPPAQAPAGVYPLIVEAVSGSRSAQAELQIEITGRVELQLTTADQRLNTTASAGAPRDFSVVVVNSGTAAVANLQLSGTGPSDWTVTFDPPTIDEVAAGATAPATARITPSADAVAGDYVVTLQASAEGADESLEIRVTVETSPVWGAVGLLLIVAVLGGLAWVFRRYGRR